jgi:hypothetical protein
LRISFVFSSLLLLTTGCQQSLTPTIVPPAAFHTISGSIYGGEQPVAGASMQIWAAGTPTVGGGIGQGAVGLIKGTLPVSDANGYFNISNDYVLPAQPSFLYITASGGSPGFGAPVNPAIVLMAVLNNCTGNGLSAPLDPSLFVNMNEVTTVGTVMALQGYMAPPSAANANAPSIGAPGTTAGVNGLESAFETSNNLVSIKKGAAVDATTNFAARASNGPIINSLADTLEYCVDSDPAHTTNCAQLFAAATPSGATYVPTDIVQAAWYIAQNPTHNIPALYAMVNPDPPFVGSATAPSSYAVTTATAGSACQATVNLNSAANFAVMGAATITNTGPTQIWNENLGLSPGTSVTGFPPGQMEGSTVMMIANPVASQGQLDALAAFNYEMGLPNAAVLPAQLNGLTLPPGLYKNAAAVNLASGGTLTFDGQGDANAVFIFQIGSTLTAVTGSQMVLINGAQAKNIFWQVGSSATLGTYTVVQGQIIASASITMNTGSTLYGRAIALNAAVTLDTNIIKPAP